MLIIEHRTCQKGYMERFLFDYKRLNKEQTKAQFNPMGQNVARICNITKQIVTKIELKSVYYE